MALIPCKPDSRLQAETNENADLVNFKIETVAADLKATDETLTKRIAAVAADLKAHRVDTDAHGNEGLYGAEWARIII